jgi:hypothetical protein
MPPVLRAVPYFDEITEIVAPTVREQSMPRQIILWISVIALFFPSRLAHIYQVMRKSLYERNRKNDRQDSYRANLL